MPLHVACTHTMWLILTEITQYPSLYLQHYLALVSMASCSPVQHFPVLFSHHRTHRKWYLYSHWGHRQNCSWLEVTSPRGASDHLRPHLDFWRHRDQLYDKTCNQLIAYYCTMAHLWGHSLLHTSVSCSIKILPYRSRNTSIFQSSPVVLHLGGYFTYSCGFN